ncbi:serine/threonine-protein kinase [Streptomyces sp. L7]
MIRAEYADDPDFRARFRREAELAARLTGRWTVPVVAADADARSPWLATAYVPGPSLAEAVALRGPWPEAQLRSLGASLAEALDGVHTAGLIHRDVKPANVLLAADGPRLIDFGIARAVGADRAHLGRIRRGLPRLPLARAGPRAHTVGPPSDVFSLGCVLAHTATGRPPFGTGGAAAVLYRTVQEEPDLDGVPEGLDGTARRCLAKEPERRPSIRELRSVLGEFAVDAWLPEGLSALVAARAARVLDLPASRPHHAHRALPRGRAALAHPAASPRRGAALGVIAAAGAGAWWEWGRGGASANTGSVRRSRHVVTLLGSPADPSFTEHGRAARWSPSSSSNREAGRTVDLALRTADDGGTREGLRRGGRPAGRRSGRVGGDRGGHERDRARRPGPVYEGPAGPVGHPRRHRRRRPRRRQHHHRAGAARHPDRRPVRGADPSEPGRQARPHGGRARPGHRGREPGHGPPHHRLRQARRRDVGGRGRRGRGLHRGRSPHRRAPSDAVFFGGVRLDRAAACARALRDAGHRGARVAGEHVLGACSPPPARTGGSVRATRTRAPTPVPRRSPPRSAPGTDARRASGRPRRTTPCGPAAHGLASVGADGRSALRSELLRRPWQGITRLMSFDASTQYFDAGDDGGGFLFRVTGGTARFVARSHDIGKKT